MIRRTAPGPQGPYGYPLNVQDEGSLTLRRAYVDDFGYAAVRAGNDDDSDDVLTVELTDVVLTHGDEPSEGARGGFGVIFDSAGTLSIARMVATDNTAEGIALPRVTTATLSDVRIERSGALGDAGAGIVLWSGETTLDRAALVDNAGGGLFAGTGATVSASDLYVGAPGVSPVTGGSFGIVVGEAGDVSLSRLLVEDVAYIGLIVDGSAYSRTENCVESAYLTPDQFGVMQRYVGVAARGDR